LSLLASANATTPRYGDDETPLESAEQSQNHIRYFNDDADDLDVTDEDVNVTFKITQVCVCKMASKRRERKSIDVCMCASVSVCLDAPQVCLVISSFWMSPHTFV
jgi:hypothetical protein